MTLTPRQQQDLINAAVSTADARLLANIVITHVEMVKAYCLNLPGPVDAYLRSAATIAAVIHDAYEKVPADFDTKDMS